jgi:transcriptional regulator with XRE-family HTH domain
MPEDVRRLVGDNVRRLRSAASLTQAKLAEKMGVDRGYISSLELGGRNPTIITLWHVAQALGVKIGSLFEEKSRTKRI